MLRLVHRVKSARDSVSKELKLFKSKITLNQGYPAAYISDREASIVMAIAPHIDAVSVTVRAEGLFEGFVTRSPRKLLEELHHLVDTSMMDELVIVNSLYRLAELGRDGTRVAA